MSIAPEQIEQGIQLEAEPSGLRSPSLRLNLPHKWQGLVLPVLLVIVWEVLSRAGLLAANWFPAPSVIFDTLLDLLKDGELAKQGSC